MESNMFTDEQLEILRKGVLGARFYAGGAAESVV